MSIVLGHDFAAEVHDAFRGQLRDVSFTRKTVAVDPVNPGDVVVSLTSTYECEGISFSYAERYIDGEKIKMGDYRVTIMLASIEAVADDAVAAELDLDPWTTNIDTVVRARAAGEAGNSITLELVADSLVAAGSIVEVGTNVRIGFLPDVTTVAQIEALIATSTLIEVAAAGAADVLTSVDQLAATPLDGGANATTTQAPGVIPNAGDEILSVPPAQTAAILGRVIGISNVTEAAVTVHVRGLGL